MWAPILIASAGAYVEKLAGYLLPQRVLDTRTVRLVAERLPIALLSAIVAVQTFTSGQEWTIDARVPGMVVAFVLIWKRANFLVLVVAATATTAVIRWLGWLP